MATSIDALDIQISAKATSANNAINRLTKNLDKLSTSLNGLNVSNVGGLSTVANQTNAVASGSTKMNNALKKTNTTMKSTSKQAWSLARAFGKFYANYFLIIRGAKALWGSIESTADYIEAYNYYNVAFGKIASEWKQDFARFGYDNAEEYADSFVGRMNETLGKLSGVQISVGADGKGLLADTGMKNLGLNIQEITQYASQLASVTNSLGQTGETSLAISQSFTKLAGDISSLFNVDYSTVAQNLQSGLIGQSRALYKYGIDITNATLQTYAYELGLTKAVSEMTQAEKQQLRVIAVLDQSKVAYGDLANTINSPSNMIRQLSTNLKEAGMVLGQLFIPMLEHVLPVVNGATIALKRLLTEIAGFFGVEIDFEKFGQGYNELEEDNSDLSGSYDDLASSIEEVKSQLLGFDEVNKLSDTSATLSVGTEDNTIDLTDEIVKATEEYQKVWDEAFANMENTSQKWAGRIEKALEGVTVELGAQYSREGADELVYLDITASHEGRKTFTELVKKVAANISIPFTVGGGINELKDVDRLLSAGADKVSINSAALRNPKLIEDIAKNFGSQVCVVAIDANYENNDWICYLNGGRIPTEKHLFQWAAEAESLGAGEILFTSMTHDGVKDGYANEALATLAENLHIPIIASGGAGKMEHFRDTFTLGKADAALAASVFHFGEIGIRDLKHYLREEGINVRL